MKADHVAVPQPGTLVDRSSMERPLAGTDAVCDVCDGRITTNPLSERWMHR